MNDYPKQAKSIDSSEESSHQTISPRFVSISKLAKLLDLSRSTVNRQIKAGNIPISRIGSRVLIPYSFIETLHSAAEATVK